MGAIALTGLTAIVSGLAPAYASLTGAATTVDLKSGRQTPGRESRAHARLGPLFGGVEHSPCAV